MVKLIKNLALVCILLCNLMLAQSVSVSAYTDSTKYLVGDHIKFHIDVEYPKKFKISLPNFLDSLKNVELIRKIEPIETSSGDKSFRKYEFVFSVYDSADVVIPEIPITYIGDDGKENFILTNQVVIPVRKMEIAQQAELADIKKPIEIPWETIFTVLIIVGILGVLFAAYYLYKRMKNKKENGEVKKVKVVIPPYKIALSALAELEEKKLWQQGKIKEFHTEVTEIIRRYFEDEFKIPALEMISSEILTSIRQLPGSGSIIGFTEEFFANADMVKFAKFQPIATINEAMIKQAYLIVNATKPVENLFESKEVANV